MYIFFYFHSIYFSHSFPSWPISGLSCQTYSSLSLPWLLLHGLFFILLCFLNSSQPRECLNLAILVNWIVYRHSALWLESPICRLDAFSLCLHVPTRVKQRFETVTGSQQCVWDDWTELSLGHTMMVLRQPLVTVQVGGSDTSDRHESYIENMWNEENSVKLEQRLDPSL